MEQQIFNLTIGLAAFLGGWWLKVLWQAMHDLQQSDKDLSEKVAGIEILVAGQYIRRDEFNRLADALFKRLDSIDGKLDHKADKRGA